MGRLDPKWTDAQRDAIRERGAAGDPLREVQSLVAAGGLRDRNGEIVPPDMPANSVKGYWGQGRKRRGLIPPASDALVDLVDHYNLRLANVIGKRLAQLERGGTGSADEYAALARALSTLRRGGTTSIGAAAKGAAKAPADAPTGQGDFIASLARREARKRPERR